LDKLPGFRAHHLQYSGFGLKAVLKALGNKGNINRFDPAVVWMVHDHGNLRWTIADAATSASGEKRQKCPG
jgi:hypothetical protein